MKVSNQRKQKMLYRLFFFFGFFLVLCGSVFSQQDLPLSFDLAVYPDAEGTTSRVRIDWEWSPERRSSLYLSYVTNNENSSVPGFQTDSLYVVSSGDGHIVVRPLIFSGTLAGFQWDLGAGIGMKTESFTEKGNYEDLGTQIFENTVQSWRLGTPVDLGASRQIGPTRLSWDITLTPFMFYSLHQTITSSLVAPEGDLVSSSLIGPEIVQDARLNLFSLGWLSVHHEFLWLSVPHLEQNDLGDAWTSVITGYTNSILRLTGGLSLPVAMGSLDIGIGWKIDSSTPDVGEASVEQGLVFEFLLSAGGKR